jgi:chromosome partitioning protein
MLNAFPPSRDGEAGLTGRLDRRLSRNDLPVAPISIEQRAAFAHALIDGRAVTEFDPTGRGAGEIGALWTWLKEDDQWQNAPH